MACVAALALACADVPRLDARTPTPSPAASVGYGSAVAASPSAAAAAVPVAYAGDVGELRLSATFQSIGVELPLTGNVDPDTTADLDFRQAGAATWRRGLPLWRATDAAGSAYYGSALLLDPGTQYEVRVSVTSPNAGTLTRTATVETRAETIPPVAALAPTRHVRETGDDRADGRSPATAWRSLDRAVRDAPAGAIVQVGPGYYTAPGAPDARSTVRAEPMTLVAEHPAVDDERRPAADGLRSVIEPAAVSSPAGATDAPNPGVWRPVTLTGPKTGRAFTVWQWAGSPVAEASHLGVADRRATPPHRVAPWPKDEADLASPAGWIEKLYTNLTYNYGFYADGSDIYLRLPGDADPNTRFITAASSAQVGLAIDGADVRIGGFEIRQLASGVDVRARAARAVIDRNLLTGNGIGVAFRGQRNGSGDARTFVYGGDHVVQENLILDSNLRAVPGSGGGSQPAESLIPWNFIKSRIREADGTEYQTARLGAASESSGVGGRGGAQRVVVRRNTMVGPFNGVGNGYNDGFDRNAGRDMDVYENAIRGIADDALEPELAAINFRAWGNRIEESLTVLSTGPVTYGPVYFVRNEAWRTGAEGLAPDGEGRLPSAVFFKFSGKSTPRARLYVLHNTLWTDRASVTGGAMYASAGNAPEAFYLRNNIVRATRYAFEAPETPGAWDEDANQLSTTDAGRGMSRGRAAFAGDVGRYREATGQGQRSNPAGGFTTDVLLPGAEAGDLQLPAASPLIDAGVPVPNLSDRAGLDYQGAAPDLGATETPR